LLKVNTLEGQQLAEIVVEFPCNARTLFLLGPRNENTHLPPSEYRSQKSADGRMATEAAWLIGQTQGKKKKRRK
jgi:hypothetical protein